MNNNGETLAKIIGFIAGIIFSVLVMFMLSGCKTTKTATEAKNETKTEQKNDVTTTSEQEQSVSKTTKTDERLAENDTLEETITETLWSAPDSTGKQFPTKTTTTERKRHRDSKGESSTTTNENKDERNVNQTIDKSQVDENIKTESEIKTTEKTRTPAWVTWGVIFIIFALLVVGLAVLKRFRLI